MAYWSSKKEKQEPSWVEEFRWKWDKDKKLTKKIVVPFGLNLDIKEVDEFLVEFFCKNSNIGRCYPFTFYW
jgi:hypothetical protein